jgi:potassium-dependent mechanosensitive channel
VAKAFTIRKNYFILAEMNAILNKLLDKSSKILEAKVINLDKSSISLGSILQLVICFVIIVYIARNLDKFLKKQLLVKLGIDEGNRAAISSIISYIFSFIAFLIILQISGFNLSSLAVIAGGLGIGIGFALQNITENFLGGLTLLIERSIKVGDFVELWITDDSDTFKGTIQEISLRSTIIKSDNGANLVLPNSKLVQKPILNWKYETSNICLEIPVKVDCSHNPLIVTEILLYSAYGLSYILKEPVPKVVFNGFVDTGLDFELKAWINDIDKAIDIKSSLNYAIEYNLRQQEIYFPGYFRESHENTKYLDSKEKDLNQSLNKPLSLISLLRQVAYFQSFNDLELRQLIETGYTKRLNESEILFRENHPGDAFYIILDGSVEVFVEKINKHLATLKRGQFFGELALILGIPRTATVKVLEATNLFVITNKGFQSLLKSYPNLAEEIVQEIARHKEELESRQDQLRKLGLVDEAEDDNNPVIWVRNRLKKVFSL